MDVERQVVPAAELRQEGEIVLGDALRRRVADGDAQPSISRAVPSLVKSVVEASQLFQRGDADRIHLGTDIGRQDLRQEG